ncbi:MAG: alpha-amylase [Candidatus Lokiarchaeota archaeon]|nr:alpha-amylase [Candidatus Lokiarchaeota archaeon]
MINRNLNWSKYPKIYEINTWSWLNKLSEKYGHDINLENIPIDIIDKKLSKFDAVWTMGAWERSPIGREIAIQHEGLQEEYRKALRYFSTDDVVGSPYSIFYYHIDSHLGGTKGMESFRQDLEERGIRLILDYVPNHVAIDHMWTLEKSDVFISGTLQDLMTKPYEYFSIGGKVYAHGRDPNFLPWTDTVQINAFSEDARMKAINTLLSIAEQCDGVRCDMAMLVTNEIFSKTWSEKVSSTPEIDFWEEVIPNIKEKYPDFLFIAEVYWDMEWKLQQQGFDYCYDKTLYDRLKNDNAQKIISHLQAEWDYQTKLLRYIENHDEERAVNVFGEDASLAAATIIMTLPGAKLIFEGQMDGNEIKLPVQLGKSPIETPNSKISEFYDKLLNIIPHIEIDKTKWSICEVAPVNIEDSSFNSIISYVWEENQKEILVVVNYSINPAKAHIKIKGKKYGSSHWNFKDLITDEEYQYLGKDLDEHGLFIQLNPWKCHIFEVKRV